MKTNPSRPAFQRLGLLVGAGVMVLTLAACGHQPGQGGMGRDDAGMASMGMMGMGRGHHGAPLSEADRAMHQKRMVERVTKELQLDEPQQQRLAALLTQMHTQRQALMGPKDGKTPREQMQALIAGDRLDRSAAQALADSRQQALQTGSAGLIAAAGDFFDGLKPEQQAKVREFLARSGPSGRHHGRGMRD